MRRHVFFHASVLLHVNSFNGRSSLCFVCLVFVCSFVFCFFFFVVVFFFFFVIVVVFFLC